MKNKIITTVVLLSSVGIGAAGLNSEKPEVDYLNSPVFRVVNKSIDEKTGNQSVRGFGSSVLYKKESILEGYKYYAITANHCLSEKYENFILIHSTVSTIYKENCIQEQYSITVEARDKAMDIAVFTFESRRDLPVANIYSVPLNKLHSLYGQGFPLGYGLFTSKGNLSFLTDDRDWLLNLNVIYGMSGGGVFLDDNNKRLVGIITNVVTFPDFRSVNYGALPICFMSRCTPMDKVIPWIYEKGLLQ